MVRRAVPSREGEKRNKVEECLATSDTPGNYDGPEGFSEKEARESGGPTRPKYFNDGLPVGVTGSLLLFLFRCRLCISSLLTARSIAN
ncbi:hypothetical protein M0804_006009 [Polistes exclamans]|nr:hypothetical protein M0804_006009 [Polistes exclamans]